jgi:HD-GYP domain-containing protein (c-di-GMP phosphodiesterase class II)
VILDPALVETAVACTDELLAETRDGDPRERVLEAEPEPFVETDFTELAGLAQAFGDLADMKTPWTHGHSAGVTGLAKGAAKSLGLDAQSSSRLEISALLADLGKVSVSNLIWEKPMELTRAEWEQVRMHAYYTERIMATTDALSPMARVAGMHHERNDGSGYHRSCSASEIPPAARILAAADAFQAMTEARPHRPALSRDKAASELQKEVRAGRLDGEAAGAVIEAGGGRTPRRRDNLRPAGLSEREVEVTNLVAAGLSNPQIAETLVISKRTAEHHVQNIYSKVGVSTRVGLAFFAHEHGLIDGR